VQQPVSQYLVARFVRMNARNLVRRLFLMAISLAFGLASLRYPMVQFIRAGPGLFPFLVSSLLRKIWQPVAVWAEFIGAQLVKANAA
jgi:hypothetical protein